MHNTTRSNTNIADKFNVIIVEILNSNGKPRQETVNGLNNNFKQIIRLVKEEDSTAMLLFALMREFGILASQNHAEYIRLIELSINKENLLAQTINNARTGLLTAQNFHKGHGVERDLYAALSYYKKAEKFYTYVQTTVLTLEDMINKRKNSNKVKQPLFFRISHSEKEVYMLGTHHSLSSSVLPKDCLDIINRCKSGVGEITFMPSTTEVQQFNKFFSESGKCFLDVNNDEDWFASFNKEQQAKIKSLFDAQFKRMFSRYVPQVPDVSKMKLGFVDFIVKMAFKRITPKKPNIEDSVSGHMDRELRDMFEPCLGLEPYFCYIELLADATPNIDELLNDSKNDDADGFLEYSNATGLTDFATADLESQIDQHKNGFSAHNRNDIFFENMQKCIDELPGPILFFFGDGHVYGKNGMLIKLAEQKIKVELFNPNATNINNQFSEIKYLYKDYVETLQAVKSKILDKRPNF